MTAGPMTAVERAEGLSLRLIEVVKSSPDPNMRTLAVEVQDTLLSMAAALSAQPAPTQGWQSIETVPKDGTAVWVSNGFSMRVAFWANGKEFEHRGSIGGGWRDFFEASHPNRMADLMFTPAYWQALPRPPVPNTSHDSGDVK